MAYLVAKTTIEESTGLVSTTVAGHMALHNDKAKAVNSLTDEMIDARNPALATPAETATSVPDLLGQLKQMLKNITGETNWFDSVAITLASASTNITSLLSDVATLIARFPVVTADIDDGAVTPVKVASGIVLQSAIAEKSHTNDNYSGTSFTDITDLEVTLEDVETGSDLEIIAVIGTQKNTTINQDCRYTLDLDGTPINATGMAFYRAGVSTNDWKPMVLAHLEKGVASGSHTVKVQVRASANTCQIGGGVAASNLIVKEIKN